MRVQVMMRVNKMRAIADPEDMYAFKEKCHSEMQLIWEDILHHRELFMLLDDKWLRIIEINIKAIVNPWDFIVYHATQFFFHLNFILLAVDSGLNHYLHKISKINRMVKQVNVPVPGRINQLSEIRNLDSCDVIVLLLEGPCNLNLPTFFLQIDTAVFKRFASLS